MAVSKSSKSPPTLETGRDDDDGRCACDGISGCRHEFDVVGTSLSMPPTSSTEKVSGERALRAGSGVAVREERSDISTSSSKSSVACRRISGRKLQVVGEALEGGSSLKSCLTHVTCDLHARGHDTRIDGIFTTGAFC